MTRSNCTEPFDGGPSLCRICQMSPDSPGLRHCSRMIAESPVMRILMVRAAKVAATDASVVVVGESGTGKEVLARAIHANSHRAKKPFVAINVAALPSELLESELFGHAKGAFTGAGAARQGLFEAADGGTLLLDEIADMPLVLQAKLLRALQDGEVRRVGEVRAFSVDVRVLCATHGDLRQAVADRRFREDLFYRLKVFVLAVPPLRERSEDVLPLARLFLEQNRHTTKLFTPEAARALECYDWPGNVRELANAVQHGAVLSQGADVDVEHLPEEVQGPRASPVRPPSSFGTLAKVERDHVRRVLEACGGRQAQAAQILGIGRTTLWRKLRELELDA